jgi:hypothetical protein
LHATLRLTLGGHLALRVQIHRDSAVGVTQAFLHDLHVLAIRFQQRCERMTERVSADVFDDARAQLNWFGSKKGEGIEYFVLLLSLLLVIVFKGSGALSIDYWLTR